jgi:hypothetical protein
MGEVMNAQSILKSVFEAYESFETYSDVGTVQSSTNKGRRPEFQTQFKRPLSFRFHWLNWNEQSAEKEQLCELTARSDGKKFVILFQGEETATEGFASLVVGAAKFSHGAGSKIIELLLPDWNHCKNGWPDMDDVRRLDDEAVDLNECFHLLGSNSRSSSSDGMELWIEKETFLVRRLIEVVSVSEQQVEQAISILQSKERMELMAKTMRAMGWSDDLIEGVVAAVPEVKVPIEPYRYEYNFNSVSVNQSIEDSVFASWSCPQKQDSLDASL